MMRLAIAIPCHTYVAPQMAQSLSAMCLNLGRERIQTGMRFFGNAVSTFGRNSLVRWAKENQATHMLWIDTDSMFPSDAANRLFATGLPFVGVNFARKHEACDSSCTGMLGSRLEPLEAGLERVRTLGFGFTLTRMDVIDAVGEPWFAVTDSHDGPCDEVSFCERAMKAGFPPYVEHALSQECAHVGFREYRLQAIGVATC